MRSVKRVLIDKIISRIKTTNYTAKPVVLNFSTYHSLPDSISRVNNNNLTSDSIILSNKVSQDGL